MGLTTEEFVEYLKGLVRHPYGIRAWARCHNVSWQYVSNVIHHRKPPGRKILEACGYERVVTYRPRQ